MADSNYDGASDDPICVETTREPVAKSWNTSVADDNTFIGNYGCSGDTNGNGVGTLNTTLTGTVYENPGFGDDADTALAIADCKDGIRNLLTASSTEAYNYTAPDITCDGSGINCYDGPLTAEALVAWKGTRLPTSNDFFGVCGDGSATKTVGNYGVQIGRTTGAVFAGDAGIFEWLSEQHYIFSARIAGFSACSLFYHDNVSHSYRFRVVFRP